MRQLLPQPLYIYIWEKTLQKISTRAKFEKKKKKKKLYNQMFFNMKKKEKCKKRNSNNS